MRGKNRKKKKGKFLLEFFAAVATELVGGRILRFTLWALDVLWLQRRTTATAELLGRWILAPHFGHLILATGARLDPQLPQNLVPKVF